MLSNLLMGKWRKKNHLPKVKDFAHYTVQNGRKVLTLYPVSPLFMPRDPKWGSHIHVTGYWYHPEQDAEGYEIPSALKKFLSEGEKPLYIRKKLCSKEEIKQALQELVSGKYDARAKELSQTIRKEDGIGEAICAIEEYVKETCDTTRA